MRKKLEQEMDRLKQKYQPRGDKMPETVCLVYHSCFSYLTLSNSIFQIAVEGDVGDAVGGGLEVCISERLSGICPEGVPVADKNGFYIQNVIVQPELRRQVSSAMTLVFISWDRAGNWESTDACIDRHAAGIERRGSLCPR